MDAVTTKKEFLAGLPIFRNLDSYAIEALAKICTEYEYNSGSVIAYQRDVADCMYIVRTGRLFARSVDQDGIARVSRAYMPGEYFNDVWLFAPGTHPATVKGTEDGRIVIIKSSDFISFLEENHQAVRQLAPKVDDVGNNYGLSAEAWEDGRKMLMRTRSRASSTGLQSDEYVEYFSRRSGWNLFVRILPGILLVLLAPVVFYLLSDFIGLFGLINWLIPLLVLLAGMFIITIRFLDWRNDYFVITNKHLMHREFAIRHFHINLVKIPIDQIQTVEILKPSLFANLVDIGTARVTTAANVGVVMFDDIDDPILVKQTLDRLSQRVQSLNAAAELQIMRQSLEDHFEVDPHLRAVIGNPEDQDYGQQGTAVRSSFIQSLRHNFGWRYVDGDVITYRKSIFVLAWRLMWPGLAMIAILILAWLLYSVGFSGTTALAVVGLLGLIDLGWLIWRFESWRNDLFQVTDRAVLDVDRKPFGFGESRKQAAISNIQNVTSERPGFFPTLFNYGFVKIETAGAQADIMFDYVVNPNVIQSDIFVRLDNFRKNQRIREGQARRQEYAVLLDVYRQALEEDRIPRRMPDGEEEFEQL